MKRANVLMLAPNYPWPANTGGSVRIDSILRGLNRHFEVTFISPYFKTHSQHVFNYETMENAKLVINNIEFMIKFLFSSMPYHKIKYASHFTKLRVKKLLNTTHFDLVYVHFIYALQFLNYPLQVPLCLDNHNVDYEYWQAKVLASKGLHKAVTKLNMYRVKAYEKSMLKNIKGYVCVSENDKKKVSEYAFPLVDKYFVAPNGVDTKDLCQLKNLKKQNKNITIGFLGSLDVEMNIKSISRFYKKIWPTIRARLTGLELELLLIGRNPSPKLKALTKEDKYVRYSGTVKNVFHWLMQVDIFIAPLVEGAGTKLKTLEAMAAGLATVGSPIAFFGLEELKHGKHFLSANNDQDFVEAIVELAVSPEKRYGIGISSQLIVKKRFNWDYITNKLADQLCESFNFSS